MSAKLIQQEVGPWPVNSYVILCEKTRASAIVDPGAEAEIIMKLTGESDVKMILITHGHPDHIGALDAIKAATGAPVYINPQDADLFQIDYDIPITNQQEIILGNLTIISIHTPGHTPGITSFDLCDNRILVGDTLFVGGPGKTWSPEEFSQQMRTMREIIFRWPDETIFFPGHGPSGRIGDERSAYETFLSRGWPEDLCGDVTWL